MDNELIMEILVDLREYLNDAFGCLQNLVDEDVKIDRLHELYDKVEASLELSTEIFNSVPEE